MLACILILFVSYSCRTSAQVDSTKAVKYFKRGTINLSVIPKDQQTKKFGFFCRQELLLEKKLSIPVKLRLGNLDYCNYLEQKTAYKLPKQ